MRSMTVESRLEGLSGGQLLALARMAVARHAGDGEVDPAELLAHAGEVVGLLGRRVLDGTVEDAALRASVVELHRLETSVAGEKLRRLRAVDERRAWVGVAMSTHGWAAEALGLTRGEARTLVATAEALGRLPQLEQRVAAGEVGVGHAVEAARTLEEVSRAVGEPPGRPGQPDPGVTAETSGEAGAEAMTPAATVEAGARDADRALDAITSRLDALAAGDAAHGDRRQARRVFDQWADRAAGDLLAGRERRLRASRSVTLSRRASDGAGLLNGSLTPTAMAKGRAVLHALASQHPAGDGRTFAQRQHDALEQVFDRILAAGELPDQAAEQPRVLLVVTPGALHDEPDAPAPVLDGWGEISNATARQLCCDAEVTTVATGDGGQVLNVGRDRRRPNRAQRRGVFARDKGCIGCGAPLSFCQVHHVLWPWRIRGRTDIDLLVTVCWDCHALIHHCGWRVHRRADGRYTIRGPGDDGRAEQGAGTAMPGQRGSRAGVGASATAGGGHAAGQGAAAASQHGPREVGTGLDAGQAALFDAPDRQAGEGVAHRGTREGPGGSTGAGPPGRRLGRDTETAVERRAASPRDPSQGRPGAQGEPVHGTALTPAGSVPSSSHEPHERQLALISEHHRQPD